MFYKNLFASVVLLGVLAVPASAENLQLTSQSVSEGSQLTNDHVFQGFGCEGANLSPQLSWTGAPEGTKSFAITAYDPDAPTGSGWWHWNAVNISSDTSSLAVGVSNSDKMPIGSFETSNDYGTTGFGGACPPAGEVHRYIFTIHALSAEKLELPANPSNALVGFMIGANTLETAKITAVYSR